MPRIVRAFYRPDACRELILNVHVSSEKTDFHFNCRKVGEESYYIKCSRFGIATSNRTMDILVAKVNVNCWLVELLGLWHKNRVRSISTDVTILIEWFCCSLFRYGYYFTRYFII